MSLRATVCYGAPFNTAGRGCTKTRLEADMDRSALGRGATRCGMPERQWR
jgi:hypothetical protein